MTILTKNHEQLTAEVNRHIEADSVAQGSYRTCFIGCLALKRNDPQYIQDTYGIPVMLTRILEGIFENLSAQGAVDFFAAFPAAVANDGKDLTKVAWQFKDAALAAARAANAAARAPHWIADAAKAAYWVAADARVAADAGVSVEWQRDLILRLISEA
jgi:hypothetical protein